MIHGIAVESVLGKPPGRDPVKFLDPARAVPFEAAAQELGKQRVEPKPFSVVVESVFALPGLGRLAYESVVQRDLNMLLGIVFVSAVLVIVVNFIVDIAYARLDPRIGSGR